MLRCIVLSKSIIKVLQAVELFVMLLEYNLTTVIWNVLVVDIIYEVIESEPGKYASTIYDVVHESISLVLVFSTKQKTIFTTVKVVD